MNAKESLKKLEVGNSIYVEALTNKSNISKQLRKETSQNGQHPYAVVLTCSDSRVVPEHIFTCGVGDIFTVRVAGNVASDIEIASITYALTCLKSPLLVVMGHTQCGAIKAAIENKNYEWMHALGTPIKTAIGTEKDELKACKLNVKAQVSALKENPEIKDLMNEGTEVLGAIYDIETGKVEFI